jgi:hypothetical protein
MTQTLLSVEEIPPDITLTRLVDRHGAWATLRALAGVLWRRRPRRPRAEALPDHLRRDIGLPPVEQAPRHHWEVR